MFTHELDTQMPSVKLVKPDVRRDAQLGVAWMAGPAGRQTLSQMGVTDEDNHETTLEQEASRVEGFLANPDQYNWMISLHGRVVGSVWASLKPTDHMLAPDVSVMIGDPKARGGGVGYSAVRAVTTYLLQSYETVYARHLTDNAASAATLRKAGFDTDGSPYTDPDGLHWQNLVYPAKMV